jgi:hypothetical protein
MADVPPTRMNLQLYKGKYVGAKKGYDLLKSKADALKVSGLHLSDWVFCAHIVESNVIVGTFSRDLQSNLQHKNWHGGQLVYGILQLNSG